MKTSWKLIPKILSGQKTIESRWYQTRRAPWNTVSVGDTIWFKDSGKPVTARATVNQVLQFENLTTPKLKDILKKYDGPKTKNSGGICFANPARALSWCQGKKYCILIFLGNPKPVKPFMIDKTGFGNACAWISVKNIKEIKIL